MTLPLASRLPCSPFCHHTLADLRAWLHAAHRNRILITCAALPLSIAAHPEGVARSRFTPLEMERIRKRGWGRHVARSKLQFLPTGGLYSALGLSGPAECASVLRVLRALLKEGWKNSDIGLLIHASMAGGVRRGELYSLPYTTDVRNHQTLISDMLEKGLLRVEARYDHQIRRVQKYLCLTPAGENLLLGRWGKAVAESDTPQRVPTEERRAA